MKLILRGFSARGGAAMEIEHFFGRPATREELLAFLAEQVPALQRHLQADSETGRPPSILMVAGGNWVHPGDLVGDDAEVDVYPPLAGGKAGGPGAV